MNGIIKHMRVKMLDRRCRWRGMMNVLLKRQLRRMLRRITLNLHMEKLFILVLFHIYIWQNLKQVKSSGILDVELLNL